MQGSTGQYYDPTQHWAALLRYDASRRQSAEPSTVHDEGPISTSSRFHKPSKVKQMSIGDDLPHMAEYESTIIARSMLPRGAQAPQYRQMTNLYDDEDKTQEDVYAYEDDLTLRREVTPPALKGENAILVDRELERLRLRKPMAKRMKWRVLTGTMMLLVLAFTAYVFAQYVVAYLALSPSNWFLSDSKDGTRISPDPLLRSMAMLELTISGIALFGILASGFYLRMTRRRSCGRGLIWFMAIISTTLNVGLSLANVALIVGWHNRYAANANDQLARARDVGLRCAGSWDMDIVWGAASNSLIAKDDTGGATSSNCEQDPNKTLQSFLIAGGVRLAVFVLLSTVWLICLARYNASSAAATLSSKGFTIEESPEMHKLLVDERGLPEMPTMKHVPDGFGGFVESEGCEEDEKHLNAAHTPMPGAYQTLSNVGTAPTIERFGWQQEVEAPSAETKGAVQTYGNIGRDGHDREGSSNAWSKSFMDRVYSALWGNEADVNVHSVVQDDDTTEARQTERHGREITRLGVRGWFASRDMSRMSEDAEDVNESDDETMNERDPKEVGATAQAHNRSPSQEERARQSRHAATQRLRESASPSETNNRFTASMASRSSVRQSAEERSSRRKQEQQDRLTFLANLQFDRRNEKEEAFSQALSPPALPPKQKLATLPNTHKTSSEILLPMPTVKTTTTTTTTTTSSSSFQEQFDNADDEMDDECDDFWHPEPVNRTPDASGPTYVRQLGKLVHRLSAIESVGSGGEQSQHQSRTSREPSAMSALY